MKPAFLRSRRGSAVAEAAVVLPVTIMVTITLVLILLFFCQLSMEQSRMHMVIRDTAGTSDGHTVTTGDRPSFSGTVTVEDDRVTGEVSLFLPDIFSMLSSDSTHIEAAGHTWDGVNKVRKNTWMNKLRENSHE